MIDSWGEIPLDIFSDFKDLGRFDMCIDINVEASNISTIFGQYCLLEYTKTGFEGRISIGICIPKTCSPEFIGTAFDQIPDLDGISQEISIHTCQTKDDTSSLRTIDVVAM